MNARKLMVASFGFTVWLWLAWFSCNTPEPQSAPPAVDIHNGKTPVAYDWDNRRYIYVEDTSYLCYFEGKWIPKYQADSIYLIKKTWEDTHKTWDTAHHKITIQDIKDDIQEQIQLEQ